MSGYEIKQLISQSIGYFWSESYGQIYPALKALASAGLIAQKNERQQGRPDKKVYSLTPAGRKELKEWLKVAPAPEVPRNELLLKLFFGAQQRPAVSREHVERVLEEQERTLKMYAGIEKKLRQDEHHAAGLPYWLMTLNHGRHYSRAMVAWAKETLKELDELEKR